MADLVIGKNINISYEKALPSIIYDRRYSEKDGHIIITAKYLPTVNHSESFCDITKDSNKIHRKHPEFGEAVSPALLQSSVASILAKELIKYVGENPIDFPYSSSESKSVKPVVTGFEYEVESRINPHFEGFLAAYTEIRNNKGKVYFSLYHVYCDGNHDIKFILDAADPVHRTIFTREKALEFGRMIGSESSESNLYSLAAASSVVADAVDRGVLSLDEGIIALYTEQQVTADTSHSMDLKKGIHLDLFLSDKARFGKNLEQGETVGMQILARDNKGKLIYVLKSPLAFPREGLLEAAIKREMRSRNRK